ncbi:MAG: porin PorA family protein [Acidimicrobiales bacterium]
MRDRHRYHRVPRTALWTGGALLGAAALWVFIAIPATVKYPTDLDVSPQYEGTFTLFVDPSTAAPLGEPLEVPLTVDRHIEAIEDQSGSSQVVVNETITQRAGDLIDTTQSNVYVMDRSTLENVADERAHAFEPTNVVDRSPAYRLNLPFDTSADGSYAIYKNEIAATYEMAGNGTTTNEEGLELSGFTASVVEAPLTDAYLAELNELVPLPETMTLDQLKPHLLAAGVDVDALVGALLPVLTPDDTATLVSVMGEPIGLSYVLSFDGQAGVETVTGAEVHVGAREAVGVRPELTSLPVLQEVLGHYPEVPEAVAAAEGLQALVDGPAITLFEYEYDQTPASVAAVADEVSSMRQQVLLATVYLPAGLAGLGVLALVVGGVVALRRRPPTEPPAVIDLRTTEPEPTTTEPEPTTTEPDLVPTGRGVR